LVVAFVVVVGGSSGGGVGNSSFGIVVMVVVVVDVPGIIDAKRSGSRSSERAKGMSMMQQQFGPRPGMRITPKSPAPMPTYLYDVS